MRRRVGVLAVLLLLAPACGRLGVGEPGCEVRGTSTAMVLSLQAVPTAKYAPCVNGLKFGWEGPEFDVKRGLAETRILSDTKAFLTVRLTTSCDVADATRVSGDLEDIERFEDVESIEPLVDVAIVTTGEGPLAYARDLIKTLEDIEVRERPVHFRITIDFDSPIGTRVDRALQENDFVWIIGELDAEEGTLELRRTAAGEGDRGLTVSEALDRMEGVVAEVIYRGSWYLRFDGGCITYRFDAKGRLAETLAADAEAAIGLYPLDVLRQAGLDAGYDVLPPD